MTTFNGTRPEQDRDLTVRFALDGAVTFQGAWCAATVIEVGLADRTFIGREGCSAPRGWCIIERAREFLAAHAHLRVDGDGVSAGASRRG
jgi:hypothetical protein